MEFLKNEIFQLLFGANECKVFYTFPIFPAYICMDFVERNQSCLSNKLERLNSYPNMKINTLRKC